MVERGQHTFTEIMSQPRVWRETLAAFTAQAETLKQLWTETAFDRVIFTGCGSTHYLSMLGARLFQKLTGVPAQAYPASELVLFPDSTYLKNGRTLLITVSRSGESSETVAAAQAFHANQRGPVITVGCYRESALVAEADLAIVIDSAREESIAQTRSFSSMAVVVELIAAYLAGRGDASTLASLPNICNRLLQDYHALAKQLGEDQTLDRFFFLGSDALYGLACEAMLKMKEMSLSYSEAFHVLEFRHGPMSMVTKNALVVGLISEEARNPEIAVLTQMQGKGARVLAIDEGALNFTYPVKLASGLPAWARAIVYLPVLQLLAYYRSMANGQNPDKPENLAAVVRVEQL